MLGLVKTICETSACAQVTLILVSSSFHEAAVHSSKVDNGTPSFVYYVLPADHKGGSPRPHLLSTLSDRFRSPFPEGHHLAVEGRRTKVFRRRSSRD